MAAGATAVAGIRGAAPVSAGIAGGSPPTIVPVVDGTLGNAGWYLSKQTVHWQVSPKNASKKNCDPVTFRADTRGIEITCSATNPQNGLSGKYTYLVKIDKKPPAVTRALPERAPDRHGWFNHAIRFGFAGTDATSGIAVCRAVTYRGPSSARARVAGRCRDRAGNVGRARFHLRYDAAPPRVRPVFERHPDRYGWYTHRIRVGFRGVDAVSGVAACSRARVYHGPRSANAFVTGGCHDRAGNRRRRTFTFKYAQRLLLPARGTRVSSAPLLRWAAVPRARYYNVQVWRNDKVLSRWPRAEQYQVHRSWRYAGHRYRLAPGRYTWYVWPRRHGRFGQLLGKSVFVVRAGG